MPRIKPRLAFINGVLLENRVLIFRFQLLAVYVLLVHNCGECRISLKYKKRLQFTINHVLYYVQQEPESCQDCREKTMHLFDDWSSDVFIDREKDFLIANVSTKEP
jgi:hypothetical protein